MFSFFQNVMFFFSTDQLLIQQVFQLKAFGCFQEISTSQQPGSFQARCPHESSTGSWINFLVPHGEARNTGTMVGAEELCVGGASKAGGFLCRITPQDFPSLTPSFRSLVSPFGWDGSHQAERLLLLESAFKQKVFESQLLSCFSEIRGTFQSAFVWARQGQLQPNPAGPHRFFRRLDTTGGVDELIEASFGMAAAAAVVLSSPRLVTCSAGSNTTS